jgi:proteasome lid subunit RPN8/RPN11
MKTLIFSPKAWLKILYMKNSAETEVSGFGISQVDNPLYVEDFITVEQECTAVTTDMDENALERYFEEQEEKGLPISSFFRIWIHTHPNMTPSPSSVDEENFKDMFSTCTWAIMVIVGKDEEVYARLQLNKVDVVGKFETKLNVEIDWDSLYSELKESWQAELKENIKKKVWTTSASQPWRTYQNWMPNQFGSQQNWQTKAAVQQSTSLTSEYSKANETILSELDKEQSAQSSSSPGLLKGKLKKIIDRLDDFDKTALIDEIDDYYDLEYLYSNTVGVEDSEGWSANVFTGKDGNDE